MTSPPPGMLLVTPVWKDSTRLAEFGASLAEELAKEPTPIRWMIADDGSGPAERERLTRLHETFAATFPGVALHFAEAHHGKGAVVREAWNLDQESEWLAFVDADGSVSAPDMVALMLRARKEGSSILAIRKRTAETTIEESPWRGLAHRLFLLTARLLLGLRCEDPQCGAKVLRADHYRQVAPMLREHGLAFDSELLTALAANGFPWKEVPVTWIQKHGGKVRPLRDAWGMLGAIWRVRQRLKRGAFQPPRSEP